MGHDTSNTNTSVASLCRVLFGVATLTLALSVWFNSAVHDPQAVGPAVEGLLESADTVGVVLAETAEAVSEATGVPAGPVEEALIAAWATDAAGETQARLAAAVVGAAAAPEDARIVDLTPVMSPLIEAATGEMSPGGVPAPEAMVDAFLTDVGSTVVILDADRVPLVESIVGAQASSSIVLGASMVLAVVSALVSLALVTDRSRRLMAIAVTFGLVHLAVAGGLRVLGWLVPGMIGSPDLAAGAQNALTGHLESLVVLGAVSLLVAASRRLGFEPPPPMVVVLGDEFELPSPAMAASGWDADIPRAS